MKRFIIKNIYFVVPVLLLHLIVYLFNPSGKGDLIRVGYLLETSNYAELNKPYKFFPIRMTYFSQLNLHRIDSFNVFVIGDSYSDKSNLGYNNFLDNDSVSVLNLNRYYNQNPVQSLINCINGNLFDSLHVETIVLESAERYITYRGVTADTSGSYSVNDLINIKKSNEISENKDVSNYDFFTERIFKVPCINLLYRFMDNPPGSLTYKVKTTDSLFTSKSEELLFAKEDVDYLNFNNSLDSVAKLNILLNKLSKKLNNKGIRLMVLVCPDKYNLYYCSIKDKSDYLEPRFFEYMDSMSKDYLYVDTKQYLTGLTHKQKDVYYYGDTHWTPETARSIAEAINHAMYAVK